MSFTSDDTFFDKMKGVTIVYGLVPLSNQVCVVSAWLSQSLAMHRRSLNVDAHTAQRFGLLRRNKFTFNKINKD